MNKSEKMEHKCAIFTFFGIKGQPRVLAKVRVSMVITVTPKRAKTFALCNFITGSRKKCKP